MKSIVTFLAVSVSFFGFSQAYFQQEVNYIINVQLNDVEHILTGDEQFEYVNNSSSTLHEIYVMFGQMPTKTEKQHWENNCTRMEILRYQVQRKLKKVGSTH